MGKFKGVLKRISGGLKLAFPIVALTLGVGGAIGIAAPTAIAHGVISNQVVEQYTSTQEYQDYIHDRVVELDEQYQNGDIVLAEYLNKVDELKEEDFNKIAEIIKENAVNNEDYVKKIETLERLKTASLSGCILGGVGLVELITFLGVGKKLLESAENDFEAANEEFEKSGKNEKKTKIVKEVKPKSKKEVEADVEQEKELKSLDEEYYVEDN